MKIAVAGTGYVGLSNAILLAQHHQVVAVDIVPERVALLNVRLSPIEDADIEDFLIHKALDFTATLDAHSAYQDADIVVIATPTDYDPATNYFNTCTVEAVLEQVLAINPRALVVIKSTVPVGYTEQVRKRFASDNIIFPQSFYAKVKRCMTTSIHHGLLLVSNLSGR